MAKLFLLSIIIATIALPARAARAANPKLGLRQALVHVSVYFGIYIGGLLFVYGKPGVVNAAFMVAIVLTYRWLMPIRAKSQ